MHRINDFIGSKKWVSLKFLLKIPHGKNFSLLYLPEGDRVSVRLAPFYDLVSTTIYPELTPRMAMKIGKPSLPDECRLRDWELYWEAIGFSQKQANRQTLEFVDDLLDLCDSPKSEVEATIQSVIRERADALLCSDYWLNDTAVASASIPEPSA